MEVPELQLKAILLKHDVSGLEHLHIAKDDSNNVFAIGFGTPPYDSTGTPHILEHTTLCGSDHYPVRDPFFKMLNRSLANYMNAFTAADFTFYPFSTVNRQDFSNLRDIYLDATLFPRLRELDFLQEGWRLEHQITDDKNTPIEFKGVVYNEMKGQISDAAYLFYIKFQRELYNGTIYGFDSGGDPSQIPNLSYKQLVDFHRQFYHPSNCRTFSYGSVTLQDQLSAINQKVQSFTPKTTQKVNKDVPPWHCLRDTQVAGPIDPLADLASQWKSSISFLCNDVSDTFETFSMRVLASLLLDGHSAPLYQALIESGIGSDYSPNTGYDNSTKTAVFSIGVQGASEVAVSSLHAVIIRVLRQVATNGFETSKIDGILHQMELSLKRKSPHFGMNLLNAIGSSWFNNVDLFELISWNTTVSEFKDRIAHGNYLESLIYKHLLDNSSGTLKFTMRPEQSYNQSVVEQEASSLLQKVSELSETQLTDVYNKGIELLKLQDEMEDISCLPTLTTADIPRVVEYTSIERSDDIQGVPIYWHRSATGLTYFRIMFELPIVPLDLQPYLSLFADCLTNLGTKTHSMAELENMIKLVTGGISASVQVSTDSNNLSLYKQGLLISAHCLDSNIASMFDLIRELIVDTNFDNTEKLRSLIRMNSSGGVSSIAESGHSFARSFAGSFHTPSACLSEVNGGITQVKLLAALASKNDLTETISKLKAIRAIALSRSSLRCYVTSDPSNDRMVRRWISRMLEVLPAIRSTQQTSDPMMVLEKASLNVLVPLPCTVNFVALSFKGVPYTHQDSAALQVLAKLMTNKLLHKEIREKGGAYGGGAVYSSATGIFDFYSYRDPNDLRTIDTFAKAGLWAQSYQWSTVDLEEAKLSIFQGIDAPTSTSSEGMIQFSDGIAPDLRQQRRIRLLDVDIPEVLAVASKYLCTSDRGDEASIVLLGEEPVWLKDSESWRIVDLGFIPTQNATKTATVPTVEKLPNAGFLQATIDKHGQSVSKPRYGQDGAILTIQITARASKQIKKVMMQRDDETLALRIALESGGCHGYQYVISITDQFDLEEDVIFTLDGAKVVIDEVSLELVDGSIIDYTTELIGSEFKVLNNPKATSKCGCDTSIDIQIPKKGKALQ